MKLRIIDTNFMPRVNVVVDTCVVKLESGEAVAILTDVALNTLRAALGPTDKSEPMYRYLSPCPAGHNTILGYLAENNPEALSLITDPCDDTKRDGFWMRHRMRVRGMAPVKVAAPLFLQERGITTVNAYPIGLLRERLG